MVQNHLSRLNTPISWGIKRKGIKFVTRPSPGPHRLRDCFPLSLLLTTHLKYAKTRKEVKTILNAGKIFINGIARKDLGFPIGLMDVISIPSLHQVYRVFYTIKGKFHLLPLNDEEKDVRIVQIQNKTITRKKKIQIQTSDGGNILVDTTQYKTRDTLYVSLKDKKILQHLPFAIGARIYITGGRKRGIVGTLEHIKERNIVVQSKELNFETAKRYGFVIGNIQTPEHT